MTTDALLMKGIASFDHLGVLDIICIVAFHAGLGKRVVIASQVTVAACPDISVCIHRMVMAIVACEGIASGIGVCLVVEQHLAGNTIEHDPYGLFWFFGRKDGIAKYPHQEKICGDTVDYLELFFCSHFPDRILSFRVAGYAEW